jgi:hypothetical protein
LSLFTTPAADGEKSIIKVNVASSTPVSFQLAGEIYCQHPAAGTHTHSDLRQRLYCVIVGEHLESTLTLLRAKWV